MIRVSAGVSAGLRAVLARADGLRILAYELEDLGSAGLGVGVAQAHQLARVGRIEQQVTHQQPAARLERTDRPQE